MRWLSERRHTSQRCTNPFRMPPTATVTDSRGRHYQLSTASSERDLIAVRRIHDTWVPSSRSDWRLPYYYRRFRPFFFVMRAGEEVVGYSVYRPSCVGARHARNVVLFAIALDSAVRGVGLGDALLSTTLGWLATAGVREVELVVEAENEAVRLYEKRGFVTQTHIATFGTLWMRCRLHFDSSSLDTIHRPRPDGDRGRLGQ